MKDDCAKGCRAIRLLGIFSATVGGVTGLITGDGLILALSAAVALLVFALALNEEMRCSQRSGKYSKGWERWGAG